jgi:hypothetical protein
MSGAAAFSPNMMQVQTMSQIGHNLQIVRFSQGHDISVNMGQYAMNSLYPFASAKFQIVGGKAKWGQRPISIS